MPGTKMPLLLPVLALAAALWAPVAARAADCTEPLPDDFIGPPAPWQCRQSEYDALQRAKKAADDKKKAEAAKRAEATRKARDEEAKRRAAEEAAAKPP